MYYSKIKHIITYLNKGKIVANIKSQKKRNRQNEKRRIRNSQVKSSIRTYSKNVLKAINNKDEKDPEAIKELHKKFVKNIDSAARKGIIKKETASRKKSRLAKKVNAAVQQQA